LEGGLELGLPRLQEDHEVCGIDHIVFADAEGIQLSGIDP
jgi:hypothetical protein